MQDAECKMATGRQNISLRYDQELPKSCTKHGPLLRLSQSQIPAGMRGAFEPIRLILCFASKFTASLRLSLKASGKGSSLKARLLYFSLSRYIMARACPHTTTAL